MTQDTLLPAVVEPPKRGPHPLPADWQPTAKVRALIAERMPWVTIDTEAAKFQAYWLMRPGIRRADWNRAFLNWCLRVPSTTSTTAPQSAIFAALRRMR